MFCGSKKLPTTLFGWLCLERKITYIVITLLVFFGMFLTKFSKLPKTN